MGCCIAEAFRRSVTLLTLLGAPPIVPPVEPHSPELLLRRFGHGKAIRGDSCQPRHTRDFAVEDSWIDSTAQGQQFNPVDQRVPGRLGPRCAVLPMLLRHNTDCPIYVNQLVLVGYNDLAHLFPDVARQACGWDPTTELAGSKHKKLWRCDLGHEWNAIIQNRTIGGTGCPFAHHRI